MIMIATVIRREPRRLLVRNSENNDEVLVLFRNANRFNIGDRIRITYNGRMTLSIPPQITASSIQRIPNVVPAPPDPAQMRAVILQRNRASLLVRDTNTNRQMRVNYPYSHHFCVGQHIIVRHESIIMGNPPQVNAVDISPIC